MFIGHYLGVLLVAATSALALASASGPSLCIQGCCDRSLKLSSSTLSLASDAEPYNLDLDLPASEIPCCSKCSDYQGGEPKKTATAFKVQKEEEEEAQAEFTADFDEPLAAIQPNISSTLPGGNRLQRVIWCPWGCPCCGGCRPLPGCPDFATFGALRATLGCDSLPLDTPLCPVGKCRSDCLCREFVLRELRVMLLNEARVDEEVKWDADADGGGFRRPVRGDL